MTWGVPLSVSYHFAFSYCSWGSQGKNAEVVCHSLLLQAKPQQYVNRELPDVQAGFRKGRGTRDQIANIRWIIEKAREFQKNISFCFIDYVKAFDCVDHKKLWKILKEKGIPPDLLPEKSVSRSRSNS